MAAGTGTNHSSSSGERFAPFGTLLEVRDAVHLRDGRSILTTVGLRRFRVIDRGEKVYKNINVTNRTYRLIFTVL